MTVKKYLFYVFLLFIGGFLANTFLSLNYSFKDSKVDPLRAEQKKVIAYVGSTAIYSSELDRLLEFVREKTGGFDEEDESIHNINSSLLEDLIEREVLYYYIMNYEEFSPVLNSMKCLETKKNILSTHPQLSDIKGMPNFLEKHFCRKEFILNFLEDRVYSQLKVFEDEIDGYFEENKERFKQSEQVKIRQIVLAEEAKAKVIRNKVTSRNFAELAKKHSISPEGKDGGLLLLSKSSSIPQALRSSFSMKKGRISDILKSPYGFHIIFLSNA